MLLLTDNRSHACTRTERRLVQTHRYALHKARNFLPVASLGCRIVSIVTLFQHRMLLIFIPPLLVFGSLSACILNTPLLPTLPSSLLPIPFLSLCGIPMGTPVFLSNPPLRFLPSCVHAGRRMRRRGRRRASCWGICALIYFIRLLVAQRLLNSTSLDVRALALVSRGVVLQE